VSGNRLVIIGQGFVIGPEVDHGGERQRLSLVEAYRETFEAVGVESSGRHWGNGRRRIAGEGRGVRASRESRGLDERG
jgi:hypothetical protein